jgi:hypothetical protein
MTIICSISNKVINGLHTTTFSAANSVGNAKYKNSKGTFKYHKVVELFRSRWSIPVKSLREFSQDYLNGKNTLLDYVPFRGKYKVDIQAMKTYLDFLDK